MSNIRKEARLSFSKHIALGCIAIAAMAMTTVSAQTNQGFAVAAAFEQDNSYERDREIRIRGIEKAIKYYRDLQTSGDWRPVPSSNTLELGDEGAAVSALSKALVIEQDLNTDACAEQGDAPSKQNADKTSSSSEDMEKSTQKEACKFDRFIEAAVKRFQQRHGIKDDGIVGPNTFSRLNKSPSTRLALLEMNKKRMESFEGFNDDEYIFVNIPEYRLYYIVDDKIELKNKVIVGKPSWATPTFSDVLEKFVVNPEWRIPPSIVADEIKHKIMDDPNYLEKKGMEVRKNGYFDDETVDPNTIDWNEVTEWDFDYFLVQRAGEKNPLGEVKYLFPNENAVYIHDTGAKNLFKRDRRAFSHGCIRMQDPFELAYNLASRHDRKTAERMIEDASKSEETLTVKLKNPIPVHLVYWTAWVDKQGRANFRDDIYDRDSIQVSSR